jgi:ribosomal protein L12E/L44/L45/RPP1/RPP2
MIVNDVRVVTLTAKEMQEAIVERVAKQAGIQVPTARLRLLMRDAVGAPSGELATKFCVGVEVETVPVGEKQTAEPDCAKATSGKS